MCDCGYDNETVEHFILHCPKYDSERSQLIDTVESLWHDVKVGFAFDKLHLVVAPRRDDTVTRKEDLLVKSALFDFLISTNRQFYICRHNYMIFMVSYMIVVPVDFTT